MIYVGIDLHKETHTAVMLDCCNTKLGEITFGNKPSEFPNLVKKEIIVEQDLILNKIYEIGLKPEMYLGKKSLSRLRMYIAGYTQRQ